MTIREAAGASGRPRRWPRRWGAAAVPSVVGAGAEAWPQADRYAAAKGGGRRQRRGGGKGATGRRRRKRRSSARTTSDDTEANRQYNFQEEDDGMKSGKGGNK